MGFLDSIGLGSVAKALDVGGAVKSVVDGILPKQLASVGDLAGAIVDFKTGNVGAALQHAMETVKDLPQVARGSQPAAGNTSTKLNLWPTLPHEPPPPPLASRQGMAFDWNDLLAALKALTAALNKQGTPGTAATASPTSGSATATTSSASANAGPATATASTTTASAPAPAAAASHPATAQVANAPAAGSSTGANGPVANALRKTEEARQTVLTANAGKPPASDSAGAATTPSAPTAAPATNGKTDGKTDGKTGAGQPSTGQTISSLAQLNGMSDSAIRDAVINGRISPDLLKDQGAMMVLQQRMNAITEMNNLMTSMMRAIHDMQMAIVQNIRI